MGFLQNYFTRYSFDKDNYKKSFLILTIVNTAWPSWKRKDICVFIWIINIYVNVFTWIIYMYVYTCIYMCIYIYVRVYICIRECREWRGDKELDKGTMKNCKSFKQIWKVQSDYFRLEKPPKEVLSRICWWKPRMNCLETQDEPAQDDYENALPCFCSGQGI